MSKDLSADGVAPEEWKPLHPLTYLPRVAGSVTGIIGGVTLANASVIAAWLSGEEPALFGSVSVLLGLVAVVVAVLALSIVYCYLSWKMTRYAVTSTAVWYRAGILKRTQRHARLSRIQTVNVSHSLLGRIVGLGYLDIEVAGGQDSSIKLGLLTSRRLEELRALLLALASGAIDEAVDPSADSVAATVGYRSGASPLEAPERRVFKVGFGKLLVSMLATIDNVIALFFGVFLLGLNGFLVGVVGVTSIMSFLGILAGAFSLLGAVWARFDREFGFTASIAADGVRISRGLTARRQVTIPPGRIHALQVTQPLIWRIFGWYRVEITQAGNASTTKDEKNKGMAVDVASDVLLPVGNRVDLLRAIAIAIPDLGVDDPEGFIESLSSGTREDRWMTPIPRSARILDPLVYKRRAFALTDAVFAIRDGFFNLRFSIIPLTRIQSVSVRQGPIQRWRSVASVRAALVPGPVASMAEHVEAGRSLELWADLSEASKMRREAEAPERWLSRVTEVVEATSRATARGE